jgi:gamma-glutamylcyclotransferase (GGCT)/AIG2-like uncharacterized protein YtfP
MDLHTLFVYGTLKRGEINHGLLAPHACSIEPASIRGLLYDTGDFPALAEGDGRVQGELVSLDPDRVHEVIAVIDRLEGCIPGQDDRSLYRRRIVSAAREDGVERPAYAYFYNAAHPSLPPLDALTPILSGLWTAPPMPALRTDLAAFEEYRAWVRTFSSPEL